MVEKPTKHTMPGFKRVTVLSCITELDESSPKKCQTQAVIQSPISSIVQRLINSSLSPKNCNVRKDNDDNEEQGANKLEDSNRGSSEGLFKNAFKIRNTPENGLKSKPKTRRFLGMASRHFSSPETAVPPSTDNKENNSGYHSPHTASPSKQVVGTKRARQPLEDCDPNSQDSGYEANYPEKEEKAAARDGFRFAEPLAVAPRRMSIESRSPMESPVRSSPQRTRIARRPSLFRSLSSGYESMDDGFNDLTDVESLDDAPQLPNGISTLLCGDIVTGETTVEAAIPITPEFPRTSCGGSRNFRRSISLQNGRQESSRKNSSSLSRVRSCLFRSPNASSSSTFNPGFADCSPLASRTLVSRRRRIADDPSEENMIACTLGSPLSIRAFKRPDPPIDESPKLVKRSRRSSNFLDIVRDCAGVDETRLVGSTIPPLQRSFSESATATTLVSLTGSGEMELETESIEVDTHAHIKSAIHRSTTDTDLTGDFSKQCILPLATGHHEDLKSISVNTLAALIRGQFDHQIGSFKIVDCRYPYEFDAGHIQGALNLYNRDLIERMLLDPLTDDTPEIQPNANKRNILVFHCEFSWERGPNLSRFLRNLDRQRNKEHYPALHYPEVYLLHGGYEQFYREEKGLCSPQGYRPMRHPDHEADLRQFRSKSKSWQGEKSRAGSSVARINLKRLGF